MVQIVLYVHESFIVLGPSIMNLLQLQVGVMDYVFVNFNLKTELLNDREEGFSTSPIFITLYRY
jgi:hypothetical protein